MIRQLSKDLSLTFINRRAITLSLVGSASYTRRACDCNLTHYSKLSRDSPAKDVTKEVREARYPVLVLSLHHTVHHIPFHLQRWICSTLTDTHS